MCLSVWPELQGALPPTDHAMDATREMDPSQYGVVIGASHVHALQQKRFYFFSRTARKLVEAAMRPTLVADPHQPRSCLGHGHSSVILVMGSHPSGVDHHERFSEANFTRNASTATRCGCQSAGISGCQPSKEVPAATSLPFFSRCLQNFAEQRYLEYLLIRGRLPGQHLFR